MNLLRSVVAPHDPSNVDETQQFPKLRKGIQSTCGFHNKKTTGLSYQKMNLLYSCFLFLLSYLPVLQHMFWLKKKYEYLNRCALLGISPPHPSKACLCCNGNALHRKTVLSLSFHAFCFINLSLRSIKQNASLLVQAIQPLPRWMSKNHHLCKVCKNAYSRTSFFSLLKFPKLQYG